MWFQRIILSLLLVRSVSADFLQNPDFESAPSSLTTNSSSSTFALVGENSTIPGWSFQGTLSYVTASQTLELPDNGHAMQLGEDGKINQTFIAKGDDMNYMLTFTLIPGGQNCSSNAGLVVSGPDSNGIFSYKPNYGKHTWQSYGHNLGTFGEDEPINLVIESQATDSDPNSTCWPIIDTLLIKTAGVTLVQDHNNLLPNGGFESGPRFLPNSTEGVLLDSIPSLAQSALRQWSVMGTVRYIDSEHFHVPEGRAAIELLSGASSGIQTATRQTSQSSRYNLTFTLGDANDGCRGDLLVGVQAGSVAQNFTVHSNGTGSAEKFSLVFEADRPTTQVSFLSYSTSQTKDGVLCGPMVDEVVLQPSGEANSRNPTWILPLFALFFIAIL